MVKEQIFAFLKTKMQASNIIADELEIQHHIGKKAEIKIEGYNMPTLTGLESFTVNQMIEAKVKHGLKNIDKRATLIATLIKINVKIEKITFSVAYDLEGDTKIYKFKM